MNEIKAEQIANERYRFIAPVVNVSKQNLTSEKDMPY